MIVPSKNERLIASVAHAVRFIIFPFRNQDDRQCLTAEIDRAAKRSGVGWSEIRKRTSYPSSGTR
jgi:hypothetical protein